MKRTAALLAAIAAAGVLGTAVVPTSPAGAAPAAAASTSGTAAYCGITWGSLPKTAPAGTTSYLTDLRAGEHACFDRLVVDVAGGARGYDVHYGSVAREGSGTPVPLRGTDLHIVVQSRAYDGDGAATYDPPRDSEAVDVTGFRTFRQVAWAGSFEGQSTIGLGVRARLPFRVTVLDGPGTGSRLVIDVAHAW